MTTRKIPFALRALTVAGVLAAATLGAQAQTVNVKMSSWVPAQHSLNPGLQAWGESLKRASGGTINPTLFPAEQLGKAFDHYDMARDGITDFAFVNPGYQPGRFPIIAGASLPFLFSNGKSGSAAIDDWYRRYAATEMKDVKFCFAFVHDPGTFHSRKKITSPADIRGMKVRPANGTVGQMVTALGGTNVQSSAPEARDILERGVADAITFPWGSITLFGIDKVVKFHMDVPIYVTPFVWVMNKGKYDALNAAHKKAVDDHCTSEWAEKVAGPWADVEAAGRTKLQGTPGHELVKLTPDQINAWRQATAGGEQAWADSVRKAGQDPKAVLDSLKSSLVKFKASL
jgi:TRAP-type C4-dicarboxylate transport system substrate-binding protein